MTKKYLDYTGLSTLVSKIFDSIYPVGSIYMSVNSTSPETLFGGTWVQIKDTFLLSAGDTYTAGNTGGSATHNHGYKLGIMLFLEILLVRIMS